MSWYDKILRPIMIVIAYVMFWVHKFFSIFFGSNSSVSWVLSIVVLVIIIRACLIPLFVKQIKASRGMQTLQPEMQRIQRKYKGKNDSVSRQRMQQEMMALYRKNGTNPMSSCLPILIQSPFFFALYRVLYALPLMAKGTYAYSTVGPIDKALAASAEKSTLFGAPLSATFARASQEGSAATVTRVVTVILIILMVATTFITQHQLTMKNMPSSTIENPMAKQQRMLMYGMPFIYLFTGPMFPVGVLIYWFTTNLWTLCQQYVVIRRMPTPGSEAEAKMKERRALHHKDEQVIEGKLVDATDGTGDGSPAKPVSGQRVQPKRKNRSKGKR